MHSLYIHKRSFKDSVVYVKDDIIPLGMPNGIGYLDRRDGPGYVNKYRERFNIDTSDLGGYSKLTLGEILVLNLSDEEIKLIAEYLKEHLTSAAKCDI